MSTTLRPDVGLVDGNVLVRIRHGKGNKARDVFLTMQTYELLNHWQTNHRSSPWDKDCPNKRADAERALLVTNRTLPRQSPSAHTLAPPGDRPPGFPDPHTISRPAI